MQDLMRVDVGSLVKRDMIAHQHHKHRCMICTKDRVANVQTSMGHTHSCWFRALRSASRVYTTLVLHIYGLWQCCFELLLDQVTLLVPPSMQNRSSLHVGMPVSAPKLCFATGRITHRTLEGRTLQQALSICAHEIRFLLNPPSLRASSCQFVISRDKIEARGHCRRVRNIQ